MKKYLASLAILFWFCGTGFTLMTDSVSQYGITWKFDKQYPAGTFANGDWWVVGPVTITAMTPAFTGTRNGWEINPPVAGGQGFDDRMDFPFSASLVPSLPCTVTGVKSICKAVSRTEGGLYPLVTVAVLTVLDALPPDSGKTVFRPPYVGTAKPYYSINQLHADLLPSYAPTANAVSLSWIVTKYQHVQFEHKGPARHCRPTDNYQLPDPYGSHVGRDLADGALGLMLNNTVQEKMPALIAYVQGGIDRYHMMLNGHTWGSGAGYNPNMKLPLYFTAALFQDTTMINRVRAFKINANEDGLLHRGKSGLVLFGETGTTESEYWEYLENYVSNNLEKSDPYGLIDGGMPTDAYQDCCLSSPWKGQALAVHIMPALRAIYADTMLLEYVDRWVTVGTWTQPDTCAPITQTPHGPNGHGGCIRDNNPADGIGRYPARHGALKNGGGYGSDFVGSMWAAYRNTLSMHDQKANRGNYDLATSAMQLPSPVKAGFLRQYLRIKKDVLVCDLAGNIAERNSLRQGGIYLVKKTGDQTMQKIIVVK